MQLIHRGRARSALLLGALLVAAACGTTVRGADDGLGAIVDDSTGTAIRNEDGATITPRDRPTGTRSDGSTPTTLRTDGGSATASAAGPDRAASVADDGLAMGEGVTGESITVGITWVDIAALRAIYTPGSQRGGESTTRGAAQAVVDHINANGGVAGRTIEPVFHEYPVQAIADASTRSQAEQAMCDHFTQDTRAFVAVPFVSGEGVFTNCAVERDLISIAISNNDQTIDEERFREVGSHWYRPNWLQGERRERVMVPQFQRRGFFTPDAKIGLLIYDHPTNRRVAEDVVLPELAAIGVTPVEQATYTLLDDMANTVLRFRSAGVTHIYWAGCPCGAIAQVNFMNTSESQGYEPIHALASDLMLNSMISVGAPRTQLARAVTIGWNSFFDVEGVATGTANEQRCEQIASDAGFDSPGTLLVYCDALFFLDEVLESATALTIDGFRASAERLGDAFAPTTAFAARFGPTRHDGVAAVRDLVYDAATDHWVYTGPPIDVG